MQALIFRLEDEFRSLLKRLCLFGKILSGREWESLEHFLGNFQGSQMLVRDFLVGSGPRERANENYSSETIEKISQFLENTRDMRSFEQNFIYSIVIRMRCLLICILCLQWDCFEFFIWTTDMLKQWKITRWLPIAYGTSQEWYISAM